MVNSADNGDIKLSTKIPFDNLQLQDNFWYRCNEVEESFRKEYKLQIVICYNKYR